MTTIDTNAERARLMALPVADHAKEIKAQVRAVAERHLEADARRIVARIDAALPRQTPAAAVAFAASVAGAPGADVELARSGRIRARIANVLA